jgi:hypothetical protein
MLKNHLQLFTKSEGPGAGGGSSTVLPADGNKEDMIEFLGSDDEPEDDVIPLEGTEKKGKDTKTKEDDKTPPKTTTKGETEVEEEEEPEVDELKELEEELEEPSEEQLELVTPVRRREILKAYPDLFKKFPYLEKAYYREQQFTEVFPTIDEAKMSSEKSQILDNFERDVMSGSTEKILKSVMEQDKNAFHKIVDDYLPTLARVDEQAYYHVLGNVAKHTIYSMVQEANRVGNEELKKAAHIVQQFVFGTSEFKPPTNLARESKPEDNTREKQITEREQNFTRQAFENSRGDLNTRVNNTLRNTIEAHIDPKSSMTDYVKKNASRDAMDTLDNLINQDSRFKSLVDKLWERAFHEGFTRESTDRIRSAYVSKAKTLLPAVIKKARNEALRGIGKRVRDDEETSTSERRGPIAPGKPRSLQSGGKINKASEIPKGMSTLDFLNSE